jgi:tRNA nucleotidyltransferase/poly(A) polymerase
MPNQDAAIQIVKVLRSHGFQALLAGGCVRDMLLARPAKDYDVATNAEPRQVMGLFRRTLEVGAKFGVVIVLVDHEQVEVATFRTDAAYADGRHPTEVRFTTAQEDALRRDFTVNGMFYDPVAEQVIDYVNGQADLARRIIRTIGDPQSRFSEDYLRMLRAVRFSSQLGFAIEPATYAAVCDLASRITEVSGERICMELEGILTCSGRAPGAGMLKQTGLGAAIFPKVGDDAWAAGLEVLARLRRDMGFALGLSAMLAGCSVSQALDSVEVLKLSRNQIRHIEFLLDHRGVLLKDDLSLARLKKLLAGPYFWDLYELQRAIQKAAGQSLGPLVRLRRRVRELDGVELRPKPLLDGHDLMRMGIAPGPRLGQLMEDLYVAQLEGHLRTPEQATRWAMEWLSQNTELRTQNAEDRSEETGDRRKKTEGNEPGLKA